LLANKRDADQKEKKKRERMGQKKTETFVLREFPSQ
jgi:hypothetical protein